MGHRMGRTDRRETAPDSVGKYRVEMGPHGSMVAAELCRDWHRDIPGTFVHQVAWNRVVHYVERAKFGPKFEGTHSVVGFVVPKSAVDTVPKSAFYSAAEMVAWETAEKAEKKAYNAWRKQANVVKVSDL